MRRLCVFAAVFALLPSLEGSTCDRHPSTPVAASAANEGQVQIYRW